MKATWQYFAEMLFIIPQKVALTFEFVNEILWNLLNCTHACSCGAVNYTAQGCPNSLRLEMKRWSVTVQTIATELFFSLSVLLRGGPLQ